MVTLARVFIATTEGPSEVQHVVGEDPDIRSVICLNGTSEALPVSRDYDAFVRKPTGVVERLFGHPSYRVDVSSRISNGHSWQLGLLVAHALHAEGRFATKDDSADEVYWVTGEVRHNLDVMPVGHIGDKLRQSESLFDQLAHIQTEVTILVPAANLDEAKRDFDALGIEPKHFRVRSIGHWEEFALSGNGSKSARRSWKKVAVILLAVSVPLSAVAYLSIWHGDAPSRSVDAHLQPPLPVVQKPTPTDVEESAPLVPELRLPDHTAIPAAVEPPVTDAGDDLRVADGSRTDIQPALVVSAVERRAPAGSGCGRLRLTGVATDDSEILPSPDGFEIRPSAGLCEVEFRVTNPSLTPRPIGMALRSTINGGGPQSVMEIVPPGASVSLKAVPNAWAAGAAWKATLVVAEMPEGNMSPERLFDPSEKGIVPMVFTYTAELPAEPRFR